MTGEITITGQVLPIGGLREKLLAAQRAEIKRVIVPRENEPDLEDLPDETRKALKLVLVDNVGEVLETALASKSETGPASITRIERERPRPSLLPQAVKRVRTRVSLNNDLGEPILYGAIRKETAMKPCCERCGGKKMNKKTEKLSDAATNVRPYVERALKERSSATSAAGVPGRQRGVRRARLQGTGLEGAAHAVTDREFRRTCARRSKSCATRPHAYKARKTSRTAAGIRPCC